MRTHGWIALLLALLLAGCGSQEPTATAETTHQAWIDALRASDRAATVALLSPDLQSYADRPLEQVRRSELGALQGVDVGTLTTTSDRSAQAQSRWQFSSSTLCYETTLAQTEERWVVTNWEPCP